MSDRENIALVEPYLACWRAGDADAFAPLFAEDAVSQDGPQPPVHGRDAVLASLARVFASFEFLDTEVRHVVAAGDVVLTERVDRHRNRATGREAVISLAGICQVLDAIERHGGYVFKATGDAFYAAFARATDVVTAAVAQTLGIDLWTGDESKHRAIAGRLPLVTWIGDFGGLGTR